MTSEVRCNESYCHQSLQLLPGVSKESAIIKFAFQNHKPLVTIHLHYMTDRQERFDLKYQN